jgi:hypothetical protein
MLRLVFVLASALAVLGGVTAGSPPQQAAAGLLAAALLAQQVLARRQLHRSAPVGRPTRRVRPALGVVGHVGR